VRKTDAAGNQQQGVRIFFDGSPLLHYRPGQDARSAITYWVPTRQTLTAMDLALVFREAATICETIHREQEQRRWRAG
jgi:hypothetical protein